MAKVFALGVMPTALVTALDGISTVTVSDADTEYVPNAGTVTVTTVPEVRATSEFASPTFATASQPATSV